jgi:hypothetical protein
LVASTPLINVAKAQIHLKFGDGVVEAESLFLQAVGEADAVGLPRVKLMGYTQLARLAAQTGKVREAHDRLAAHYASLSEGFERAPAREAKAALDELTELLDDMEQSAS